MTFRLFELPKIRDFIIVSRYVYLCKNFYAKDFYAKECLQRKVNREKGNYDLGVGPDEK